MNFPKTGRNQGIRKFLNTGPSLKQKALIKFDEKSKKL